MTMSTTRRRGPQLVAALAGIAIALSGCSSETPAGDDQTTSPAASAGAFPVTLMHDLGEITINETPERVVILDEWYIDSILALGVQPVAIEVSESEAKLLADQPWLKGRYTGEIDPGLVTSEWEASPEAIAAWEPDLIGATWMMDEQVYGQLSAVAPTWAGVSTYDAWDVLTALGDLTGNAARSELLIAGVDDAYAAARHELPGLAGRTFVEARAMQGGTFDLTGLGPWEELGMVPADNQPVAGDESSYTSISLENLGQLDADLVTIGTWPAPEIIETLDADPRFAELPASKNGAIVFFDTQMVLSSNGPTATQWLLDKIVTQLKDSPLNREGQ